MHDQQGSVRKSQMHYSPNVLNTIFNAIERRKLTHIEYDSREKGRSIREIEPMQVIYKGGKRNLIAYCRLRTDYRCFRLDRINTIIMKPDDYLPRPDFNVDNFMEEGDTTDRGWL